jgi:hypothetical protein
VPATYESIYAAASAVQVPDRQSYLQVEWIEPSRIAIGRDADGRVVILIGGEEFPVSSEAVREAITYGSWSTPDGTRVDGSLLHLSADQPFLVAATTIATELLRCGIATTPAHVVFPRVEAFIDLVMRRVVLPPETILGLLGELLVLDSLLDGLFALPTERRPDPCSLWRGFSRQSRDFVLNTLAIEVKTTSSTMSKHLVGGLDQVSARPGSNESLFLASVGLAPDPSGNAPHCVFGLVERIIAKLDPSQATVFLDQLTQYGPEECSGYHHATMSNWEPYRRPYRITFAPRLYDMGDPHIRVLRRADLQGTCVQPEGISFTIILDSVVPGSRGENPSHDLTSAFIELVRLHQSVTV